MILRNEGKYEKNDAIFQDCGKFGLTENFTPPSLTDALHYVT